METTQIEIKGKDGRAIQGSRALIWGNNAAWLCPNCDHLLGNRTGDTEFRVACACGARYEIQRSRNKSGKFNLGPATGVVQL
jgi:hypothetical protein